MNITPETTYGLNAMVEAIQTAGHKTTLGMLEINYPWPIGQKVVAETSAHQLFIGLTGERYSKTMIQNLFDILKGLQINKQTKRIIIDGETTGRIESHQYKKIWINVKIAPNEIVNRSLAILTVLNTVPHEEIYYVQLHIETENLQAKEIKGHFNYALIDRQAKTITWYHYSDNLDDMENSE